MITMPSLYETEVRVLRTIVCRPELIDEVPDLETNDFWDMGHRLLWDAIRLVAHGKTIESSTDLRLRCAAQLDGRPGSMPQNYLGMLAIELRGERNGRGQPAVDPRVFTGATPTLDAKHLRADAKALRFSARARDQMLESKHPTTRGDG